MNKIYEYFKLNVNLCLDRQVESYNVFTPLYMESYIYVSNGGIKNVWSCLIHKEELF
jgi:hypothetical protein